PLLSPALVAVGGVIASGKGAFPDGGAGEVRAPVVDTDRTRKELLGVEAGARLPEGAWSGAYDPEGTERVYPRALGRAEGRLGAGRRAVLDPWSQPRRRRDAARDLAGAMNAPFRFIECRASPEVPRARLLAREHRAEISDARLDLFDDFMARFEPITELP